MRNNFRATKPRQPIPPATAARLKYSAASLKNEGNIIRKLAEKAEFLAAEKKDLLDAAGSCYALADKITGLVNGAATSALGDGAKSAPVLDHDR
jgi:hypothetical protein